MAELSIDAIETALAAKGMDTNYTGMEHGTSFTITSSSKVIEILDGVSGDFFRPDHVIEAILYGDGNAVEDATRSFEDVETVEEFLAAVDSLLVAA
jgi:hypothetical protein